jgi:hypothetical protein
MGEGVHHEASDSPNGGGDRKGNGSICKVWFGLVAVNTSNLQSNLCYFVINGGRNLFKMAYKVF